MKKIIIGLDMDIIPGRSIGGISLGDYDKDIIECINNKYVIEKYSFNNQLGSYALYKIHNGAISFTSDEQGVIIALWCEPPYKGSYKRKLYPGITALELKKISKTQEIIKGYLVIDKNFFIYYGMPDNIDDFNSFSDIDDKTIFNELYVGNLI
ncbi:hypothetical protein BGI32_09610 [Snodgrassella alvi]|jgi:hypothetical protein|uniref:Uncharacterized protein n=1 Tax=Snodgrassella alvi TaxID=1196083 RepID=A0A2N9WS11_9NEIS|nr:hypothetical protein [Snodgrassella alvi]PIT13094.1 hypothetical protein BGI32_09610 [Snodgrassella alvi]